MNGDEDDKNPRREADEHDPAFWWLAARRLKHSADLAWAAGTVGGAGLARPTRVEQQLNTAFVFLAGLCLEYLAMAWLVDSGRPLDDLPNHRLRHLLERCAIEAAGEEQDLLRRAEAALQWHERFTIAEPVAEAALGEEAPQLGGWAAMLTPRHKAAFDSLFARLRARVAARLDRRRGAGTTGPAD